MGRVVDGVNMVMIRTRRTARHGRLVRRKKGRDGLRRALSHFDHLFKKLTSDEKRHVKNSLEEAARIMDNKDKRKDDRRGLTYRDINMGVLAFARGSFPEDIYTRCEKADGGLYGIEVSKDGSPGTLMRTVTGREGNVVKMRKETGFCVYTIRWSNGGEDEYSTGDVLRGAVGGHGVTTLDEDRERFRIFLCATLNMVNTHVYKLVCEKANKDLEHCGCKLGTADAAITKETRTYTWQTIQKLTAAETVSNIELGLVSKDAGLAEKLLHAEGSFLRLLGLSRAPDALMKKLGMGFHDTHGKFVDHIVKGAHSAWQLGRFTSTESCTTPLAAGVHDELPPGVSLDRNEQMFTSIPVSQVVLEDCCLATRALLARSLDAERGVYEWYREAPLYRLQMFNRPDKGEIEANSENSSRVAITRKHLHFYNFLWGRWFGSVSEDWKVHNYISKSYNDSVARTKRNKGHVVDNENARDRFTKKFYDGRVGKLCYGWPLGKLLGVMKGIVESNGIKPIMDKILPGEVENSLRMLVADEPRIDKRTNEDHLKADWVDATVDRLIGAGITQQVVSTFSQALATLDSITSACLRPQDALGCLSRYVHYFEGELLYRMPTN